MNPATEELPGGTELTEPAAKKIKLDLKTKPRLEAVLDDSLTKDVDLVAVCVGRILNKKATRSVILDLNAKHPVPSLAHLKRVRNDQIIIKITESLDGIEEFLQDLKIDCTNIGDFEVIVVAKTAPITRRQFEIANKKWPCNFHENKTLEKIVNADFSEEELVLHEKWMRVAVQLAKDNDRCSAAVVVDPSGDVMVCKSVDNRACHPLQHAIMLAVDLVACSQGGGAWVSHGMSPCKNKPGEKDPDGPYLCTGYDVYTTREPCIMCAMALVHSRAKRVFYGTPKKDGALGSSAKIHLLKELNHHYEVYRYLLHDECAILKS